MTTPLQATIIGSSIGVFGQLLNTWYKHHLENPQQSRAETASINIGAVIRDVGIIWVLTAIPSFVAAVPSLVPIGLVFMVIGFVISGSLVPRSRWKHLFAVAIVTWLSSFLNVLLGFYSLEEWLKKCLLV